MGLTTDPADPGIRQTRPDGQQQVYLVLSEEERARGFARPVRDAYLHLACGGITRMGLAIAETYSTNPKFYSGTYCSCCRDHFALVSLDGQPAFVWDPDGDPVGSDAEEAEAFLAAQRQQEAEKHKGGHI